MREQIGARVVPNLNLAFETNRILQNKGQAAQQQKLPKNDVCKKTVDFASTTSTKTRPLNASHKVHHKNMLICLRVELNGYFAANELKRCKISAQSP
jgi:hypothetical protein